jgi:alpha-beta hydrolase superfamily lysophospholipase
MIHARWLFLAIAFLLAGCATAIAPRGGERAAPVLQDAVLVTGDGAPLPLRHWDAAGHPRAVLIALHGMNDYSNAFDAAGRAWAKQGFTTIAYDQRGFGKGPDIGVWAGSDAMRQDFLDCVAAARARYPGVPLFAVGESMGGAILLTILAEPAAPALDGVVLISPAVWSRADMPLSYRVALFLGAHLTPGMIVSGNGLKIVPSDNIDMLRALSRDPYVIKETRVDAVFGLVNLMDEARQAAGALSAPPPILFLHGAKDPIIPPASAEAAAAALGSKAVVRVYDQGYHMLLRDLDGSRVQQDVADWIGQRLAR